jgi:hypothetical protein
MKLAVQSTDGHTPIAIAVHSTAAQTATVIATATATAVDKEAP